MVLAALINACRVSGKVFKELKIVVNGAGAAGIAITRLLFAQGAGEIILVDSKGIIHTGRTDLNATKKKIARTTNRKKIKGSLAAAMIEADVFIGVSQPDLVSKEMVRSMNPEPIIFAMANPKPEILPEEAIAGGAAIVGTGRSDYPNQVNNALVFPGIFRGLLDGRIRRVTTRMKIAAALAVAYSIKPKKDRILPSVLDKKVVKAIAKAIIKNR